MPGPAGPAGPGGAQGYYGSFYSTVTQPNVGIGQVNTMAFDTAAEATGVFIANSTELTFANAGVFNVQFSAQFDKTDAGDDELDIWISKNGIDVEWTNTRVTVHGNDGKAVPSWNFMLSMGAGDYLEFHWSSPDANMRILALPAQTGPTRPSIPSIILTAQQVMFSQAGGGGGSMYYLHSQQSPSDTWTVTHGLGARPNISTFDSQGDMIEGDISHTSSNQAIITFGVPVAGNAYLS